MADYVLKDQLFNSETVTECSDVVKKVYNVFEAEKFTAECLEGFPSRELKERMTYVCEKLESYLPQDFMHATEIMLAATRATATSEGFVYGAFCEYVERNGCTKEYLTHSLNMLGEFTKVFSAEFAIRKFINDYPETTFQKMLEWAASDDVHQRRLASEGLRPKLPWGTNINFDPIEASKPLEYLYYDEDRYVVRSVANHLNDLSKVDPEYVIATLDRWEKSEKQTHKEMSYLISHSLRTLIKRGHPGALTLLGYKSNPDIEVTSLDVLTPEINIGDYLEFQFEISAGEDTSLMVDYVVDYPMKNGRSSKVFKLKKCSLKKGETQKFSKRHQFKQMTTKKLYSGQYEVRVQINGKLYSEGRFGLTV